MNNNNASPLNRRPVVIQWQLSSFFGWGIYGLNLAINWSQDPDLSPLCSYPILASQVNIDAVRMHHLMPFFNASHDLQERLKPQAGQVVNINVPVLQGLGNGFSGGSAAHRTALRGTPTLGIIFFENTQLDAQALERAKGYKLIVTGSTWNQKILEEYGIGPVTTVIQGVDPTLFHPAPRAGYFKDRFLVFSGGKLEYRKGQDLTLLAFRAFAQRHPEAMLVTAWHSPWPKVADSVTANKSVQPVPYTPQGKLNVRAWAAVNGVPADKVIDLGEVPNAHMAPILREMDVAVFPNRGEGGTNLVAMECMACGVLVILSKNTGHLDLIEDGNSYVLEQQKPLPGQGAGVGDTAGWGESEVDEIVEALEAAWRNREDARRRGAKGAEKLAGWSWANQTAKLKEAILPYL
ncbi:MAG TPA: glycosyltransferase family 4 protein [Azospirillaceae bacterium]|nr:glycosyltransferase family 4 protein [Azospirillaceae bacterium]